LAPFLFKDDVGFRCASASSLLTDDPSQESNRIVNITTKEITGFWWSADSEKVFFITPAGVWEYDLVSKTTNSSSYDSPAIFSPRQFPRGEDTSALGIQPDYAEISPDGRFIVYEILKAPTPTPFPTDAFLQGTGEGPTSLVGWPIELWMYDGQDHTHLGIIENCVTVYLWSKGGEIVILADYIPFPGSPCEESFAWNVDLRDKSLIALFPRNLYSGGVYIDGLSPSGERLTFSIDNRFGIMDLEDLETKYFDDIFPDGISSLWINDDLLLIFHHFATIPTIYPYMAIFNPDTHQILEVFATKKIPELNYASIDRFEISPNGRWLVFTSTVQNSPKDLGLWLIDLAEIYEVD